ncbi:MAG: lipopolysaccharide kinase InaA family protein [Phycisphaerae bacterium]|nr:lipopolysaccharide kinase InaA family protein [Phycisphaerae bacterium]
MTQVTWLDAALSAAGLDTVEGAFAYGGGSDLTKPSLGSRRRRTEITLTNPRGAPHVLYLKRYGPEKLLARLRRAWTYGWGTGPAVVEHDNIQRARAAGVPTMQVLRFGQDAPSLAGRRGYLVVTAVPGEALERCAEGYLSRGGPAAGAVLAVTLAELVAALHTAGYVHRDLYASHVFLEERSNEIQLCLIDLARMFAPRWRVFRWRVKDLAQLKYSMPPPWVQEHWDAFLRRYLERTRWRQGDRYNRAVDRKACAIARRIARAQVGASSEGRP